MRREADITVTDNEETSRMPRFNVALYVTCLVDLFRPSVAFDSIALLERAGCKVSVPTQQSCCGQPSYNTGDYESTIPLAQQVIKAFEFADYVVVPSGSCTGMITHHYPKLLEGQWRERALTLAAKTFELTTFLAEIAEMHAPIEDGVRLPSVTYHDSCAGLRELGVRAQPRDLLKNLRNTEVKELSQTEVCCGFGGTFCAKMPELSAKMASDKLDSALATEAKILAGGDMRCLMNIAGRAKRLGKSIEVRHVAELLAGDLSKPAIGEGKS
jgi:L-lactate dehydrogenase complex protein LldE